MSSIESAATRLPCEKPQACDSGDDASSKGTQQQYQYLRTRTVQISTLANVLILVLTGFVAGFVLLSDSSVIDSHLPSQLGVPVRFLLLAFSWPVCPWPISCEARFISKG